MSYNDNPQTFSHDLRSADQATPQADNTDCFSIIIPANREVEIQLMSASVRLGSGGADFVELVTADDAVLAKVPLENTGVVAAVASDGSTASTFPIRVPIQSATVATELKLRMDGTVDATTAATIQITISGL